MSTNLEEPAMATGRKRSIFIPIPRKGSTKECSNHGTFILTSPVSKAMLKFLHSRLPTPTKNFQTSKLGLEKAEEPEIRLQTFAVS